MFQCTTLSCLVKEVNLSLYVTFWCFNWHLPINGNWKDTFRSRFCHSLANIDMLWKISLRSKLDIYVFIHSGQGISEFSNVLEYLINYSELTWNQFKFPLPKFLTGNQKSSFWALPEYYKINKILLLMDRQNVNIFCGIMIDYQCFTTIFNNISAVDNFIGGTYEHYIHSI